MHKRRYYAWLAVIGSVTIHIVIASYLLNAIRTRSHLVVPSQEPIVVRIESPAPLQPAAAKIQSTPRRTTSPTTSKTTSTPSISLHEQVVPPQTSSAARATTSPEMPASSPSTEEILRRITDGALKNSQSQSTQGQVGKPWLTNTRPLSPRPDTEQTALGNRIERVHSATGTYCVVIPNATAYRNSNGVNLAVASNCP